MMLVATRWANAEGVAAAQPLKLKEAFFKDVQLLEDPVMVSLSV